MSLVKFGDKTKSVFLKEIDSHKLHQEFEVAATKATIKGQAVILNATGEILAAPAGTLSHLIIGHALHTRAAGELCTVAMKAVGIVWGQSLGALVAGPVKVGAAPTDTFYGGYLATALGTDVVGYALDAAAGVDEIVRVAIL